MKLTDIEIEKLANKHYRSKGSGGGQYTEGLDEGRLIGFINGFQTCQDMQKDSDAVEFAEWLRNDWRPLAPNKNDWINNNKGNAVKTTELYQLFLNRPTK